MRAFEFKDDESPTRTAELSQRGVETEWQLESWLHANPDVILDEPLLIFGRQYGLDTGIPDLLALDQWGNTVVAELKKGQSGTGSASEETILSQPQNYAQSLSSYEYKDLEDIYGAYKTSLNDDEWEVGNAAVQEDTLIEAHQTVFGGDIDRTEFNEFQRMVILAEDITSQTESNARYLLKRGLDVQCVEVQWFASEAGHESSILVSSTVVDYPLSRVQPERSSADYSNLTEAIRDRVAGRVGSMEGVEKVRATPTQVRVNSEYPPGLRYDVYIPGTLAGRQANIRMNASDISDGEVVEKLRSLVTDYADGLDKYYVEDERVSNVVYREPQVTIQERDLDTIEEITKEVVSLVEWYQPKIVNEFSET
jgi:hypothetical protein